jgi:hypothetical protein
MKSSLRRATLPILAACLTLALRLSGADAPSAPPTVVAPAAPAAAVTPAPGPKVMPLQLPKALEGVVTLEEFTALVKFQQTTRAQPEIVALNEQIRAKLNEVIALRKQAQAAQQKAIDANPDIKAIADKIKAHTSRPPMPPGAAPGAMPAPLHPNPQPPVAAPTPAAK